MQHCGWEAGKAAFLWQRKMVKDFATDGCQFPKKIKLASGWIWGKNIDWTVAWYLLFSRAKTPIKRLYCILYSFLGRGGGCDFSIVVVL